LEQDPISTGSKIFLGCSSDEERRILIDRMRSEIIKSLEKKERGTKLLALFYLLNDILYRSKNDKKDFAKDFEELFQTFFKKFSVASESFFTTKILNKIFSVLKIWEEQKLMNELIIKNLISLINDKLNNKKEIAKIKKLDFEIQDLLDYVENKNNLEIWEKNLFENERKKKNLEILVDKKQEKELVENSIKMCEQKLNIFQKKNEGLNNVIKENLKTDILKILVNIHEIEKDIQVINSVLDN
jgi:hypothetical protein